MKLFVWFLGFIFLVNNDIFAIQPGDRAPIDSTFHDALTVGSELVLGNQYLKAIAFFDSLEQLYPNHPAPNFYKAATYQKWMLTYRFSKFQDDLYENAKLSIEKGTRLLKKEDDPWLNFYVGAAYGFKALHRFRKHDWIGAYLDGRNGINNFNDALEKLPNLYDCFYGLGAYNYWRTAKSKFIRILTFWMSDNRELGLAQMKLSVEHGRYCSFDATHGLMIAYYHHEDYDELLELNNVAMTLIDPPSMGTLYIRGRLMVIYKNWPAVQDMFEEILGRLVVYTHQSIGYQVECKYWIALSLKNQNKLQEASKLTVNALAQSKNYVKEDELENPFENFEEIEKRLEKLHENLRKEISEQKLN